MNRFDIVTVAHGVELSMLKMQARSLRLFIAADLIGTILVVNNDQNQAGFRQDFMANVISEYGHLSGLVRFIDRGEILQGFDYVHGWHTQQALKLIAASLSEQDFSVILDSKNHFVRPITDRSFLTEDGRLVSCLLSQRDHLQSLFKNSFLYFGVDPDEFIDQTLPNLTPIPIRTSTVRGALAAIEARESRTFAEFFLTANGRFAEFYLLAAYIAARDKSFDKEYDFTSPCFVTIFPDKVNAGAFKSIFYQLALKNTLSFAIHWAARPLLDEELKNYIARFWIERGLVQDRNSAEEFFTSRP